MYIICVVCHYVFMTCKVQERARPEPDAREDFSPTVSLDASIRNAALNLGGGEALDSLRSELLARLEGSPSGRRLTL